MYVTVMDEYYLEKAKEERANGVSPDVIAKSTDMPIERVRTLVN